MAQSFLNTSNCWKSQTTDSIMFEFPNLYSYYLLTADQAWHVNCLRCCRCSQNLDSEHSCYSRDGLIYCKEDYYRWVALRLHVAHTSCAHLSLEMFNQVKRRKTKNENLKLRQFVRESVWSLSTHESAAVINEAFFGSSKHAYHEVLWTFSLIAVLQRSQ